jgi:hypothetical protein
MKVCAKCGELINYTVVYKKSNKKKAYHPGCDTCNR